MHTAWGFVFEDLPSVLAYLVNCHPEDQEFWLLQLRGPTEQPFFMLCSCQKKPGMARLTIGDDQEVRIHLPEQQEFISRIISRYAYNELHRVFPLQPAPMGSLEELYFLVADEGTLNQMVHAALLLENSMQFTRLQGSREQWFLVRLEQPSYYFIEQWQDCWPVFYPAPEHAHGRLLIAWGYTHPLTKWIPSPAPQHYLLITAQGEWHYLAVGGLQDIYQHLEIRLPPPQQWNVSPEGLKFKIQLKLETTTAADADLWLLQGQQLYQLQEMFALLPQESLKNILVGVWETSQGRIILVKELISGRDRQHFRFPGEAFKLHEQLPNLYLPVNRCLNPNLPAGTLRSLLKLVPEQLTLLRSTTQGFEQIRVAQEEFRLADELVEYIIPLGQQRLQQMQREIMFDLEQYLPGASSTAGPAGQAEQALLLSRKVEPSSQLSPATSMSERYPVTGEQASLGAHSPAADDLKMGSEGVASEPLADHGALERNLGTSAASSSTLVSEGQSTNLQTAAEFEAEVQVLAAESDAAQAWEQLGWLKIKLGKVITGLRCLERALWERDNPQLEERLQQYLYQWLGVQTEDLDSLAQLQQLLQGPRWQWGLRVCVACMSRHPALTDQIYHCLRTRGHELGLRARWLIWRQVLRISQDQIEQEHQRAQILGSLARHGLSWQDRFIFVELHLIQRYTAQYGDTEGEELLIMQELPYLCRQNSRLFSISQVHLGWAWLRCGQMHQASQCLETALSTFVPEDHDVEWNLLVGVLESGLCQDIRRLKKSLLQLADPRLDDYQLHKILLVCLARLACRPFDNVASLLNLLFQKLAQRSVGQMIHLLYAARVWLHDLDRHWSAHWIFTHRLTMCHHPNYDWALLAWITFDPDDPHEQAALQQEVIDFWTRHLAALEITHYELVAHFVDHAGFAIINELQKHCPTTTFGRLLLNVLLLDHFVETRQDQQAASLLQQSLAQVRQAQDLSVEDRLRILARLVSKLPVLGADEQGLNLLREVAQHLPEHHDYLKVDVLSACALAAIALGSDTLEFVAEIVNSVAQQVQSASPCFFYCDILQETLSALNHKGQRPAVQQLIQRIASVLQRLDSQRMLHYYPLKTRLTLGKILATMEFCEQGEKHIQAVLELMTQFEKQEGRTQETRDLLHQALLDIRFFEGSKRSSLLRTLQTTIKQCYPPEHIPSFMASWVDHVLNVYPTLNQELKRYILQEEHILRRRVKHEQLVNI